MVVRGTDPCGQEREDGVGRGRSGTDCRSSKAPAHLMGGPWHDPFQLSLREPHRSDLSTLAVISHWVWAALGRVCSWRGDVDTAEGDSE